MLSLEVYTVRALVKYTNLGWGCPNMLTLKTMNISKIKRQLGNYKDFYYFLKKEGVSLKINKEQTYVTWGKSPKRKLL